MSSLLVLLDHWLSADIVRSFSTRYMVYILQIRTLSTDYSCMLNVAIYEQAVRPVLPYPRKIVQRHPRALLNTSSTPAL
jgi:hypothetical protein